MMAEEMQSAEIEIEMSLPVSPDYPSGIDDEITEESFNSIARVDPDIAEIDWKSMTILNGRNEFIVLYDLEGYRCFSLLAYYKIMGKDHEPLLIGKRLHSIPGCKPYSVYVKDENDSAVFSIKFVTFGCFPVLKRIEVRDGSKKRIGVVAEISKVLSLASYQITNEQEGVQFHVRSKLNLVKGHDYEILESNKKIATIDRQGPAHLLTIKENAVVTCSNKSLFIALCIFLDIKRRQFTS